MGLPELFEANGKVFLLGREGGRIRGLPQVGGECGVIHPGYVGMVYLVSEVLLSITRRSRGTGVKQDRSTLRILWLVIGLSVGAGIYVATHWRAGVLPFPEVFSNLGVALFVAGLTLRWWAIVVLGRFFTVDVQIAADHEVVERGPFRVVRHPSYTGVLLAFLGFALTMGNGVAVLVLMGPIWMAFVYRMRVEEEALTGALGEKYLSYMRRTKRLVPGVY